MMFGSLRTRLWLTYALLAVVVLIVVAGGLLWALADNPVIYRQEVLRLRLTESVITIRLEELPKLGPLILDRVEKVLQREAEARKLRIAIIKTDGTVVLDVGPGREEPLPKFKPPLQTTDGENKQALVFRDSAKQPWLYTLRQLDTPYYLMVATPRPVLLLRNLFTDDVLGPFMQALLVALGLALLLSLAMGQWIAHPLKRMADAAQKMDQNHTVPLPETGPAEMRLFARSFNELLQRLNASQQSQRDFIANVSHELKTPLTSIQGFSQAILDGTVQTPEAVQQAAGTIFNESSRMYRLVLDLLSLARLESGTADLQHTPVDLTAVLRSIVERFSLQAKKQGVTLSGQFQSLPRLIGDGDRLAQVFSNLADNALKFTPADGSVSLSAVAQEGWAYVRVSDTGSGIPAEALPRIFERFYQVDRARRGGSGRGMGLGLSIAQQIVLAHGGQIWAESTPGKGTQFMVRLPLARPEDKTLDARTDPGV